MPFELGAKLSSYEILAPIGAGPGVEAYKATDTQAERTVAIEVIPPEWVAEPEFPARKQLFETASQAVAALNHPRIRVLHEVGQTDGADYLVYEHLEGQTLAERLKGGAMALSEAISVVMDIAEVLDKAHGAGVAHRDLNTSNVVLTKEGVKVSGFGWAELRPPPATPLLSRSPAPAEAGKKPEDNLTLNYMAPEQVEAKPSDHRSDLFALGALFYEMATGKKAFEGRTRAVLIAAITTADPEPLSQFVPGTPRSVDHVLERCLEKNPDDRWQTAHDLLLQLRWIVAGGAPGGLVPPRSLTRRLMRVGLIAAALLVATLAYPAVRYLRGSGEVEALQFRIPVAGLSTSDTALSPDGEAVALVARPNSQEPQALYVRRMASPAFLRLAGTENAAQPFWSPDSRYLGFVAGGRLKSVNVAGGAPKDLADASGFAGGDWNSEGTILFGSAKGLFRVSAEGGKPTPVTTVAEPETGHLWPSFLPDGRHFLFLVWSSQPQVRGVCAGSLDSKDKTKLIAAESNAVYAAPGYVLFHREASLFAQSFDPSRRALQGEPVHVADDIAATSANGRGHFSVSAEGGLVYFQGANSPAGRGRAVTTQFGWVDRTGNRGGTAGDGGTYGDMDLSPDGKLIAVTAQEGGTSAADIWVVDWQRGASTRLTLDPADDVDPIWSPDGTRVAFTTYRKGNGDIYVKNANNVGAETPLLATPNEEIVKDWSKDGRYIAYLSGADNNMDIYALSLATDKKPGEDKPIPLVQGRFQKNEPQFSYDGKWLAYTTDETGAFQVTVQSFPAGDQKLQVSTAGGGQPRWRRDGKEIYFRAPDAGIMAVEIKTSPKLEAGVPRILFRSPSVWPGALDPVRHQLAVTPDGQRFLLRFGNAGVAAASGPGGGPAVPEAQPFASTGASGRGAALLNTGPGGGSITTGLTVIRRWAALRAEGEK